MRIIETRKLEDSSWLAQIIKDKMDVEFNEKGHTLRWHCLHVFHIIINEADDKKNENIYCVNNAIFQH